MSDDLKPGFYYVRHKNGGELGGCTVGQLLAADAMCPEPYWNIIGSDSDFYHCGEWFQVGAYLDPQPGEQR